MSPYLLRTGGDPVSALRLHCWNTEISSAFYGPLQFLEVAMRVGMNRQLALLFGQDDWWNHPNARLTSVANRKIADAVSQVTRLRLPVDAEQITDQLSFGFWVALLGRGDNYDQRLWRPALHKAFPHFRGPRRELHARLDHHRILRNKIAHHGPIHNRHLTADYESIVTCLTLIDPDLAAMVRRHGDIAEVLSRRP
ncbi:hypothetical protein [Herbidospora sp. NBRC 101105]|uniref:hypothetical protein n=1 Tax=Herbidospora sp. NBRC 101105 TaxID=3032195 RepID=UPI0025575DE2|nr:hypothetical protein [Herbidospora sp. NBRC 101105]